MRLLRQFKLSIFLYDKILHRQKALKDYKAPKLYQMAQKAPKSTKSKKKHNQAKAKNANKRIKIKNALKNI